MRFQTMAPTSPHSRTQSCQSGWIALMSTMSLPMVFATASPSTTNAMKLKKAAQTTAAPGLSTRVETTVAMEFAASWNPLM
jgi:hypothetical protein